MNNYNVYEGEGTVQGVLKNNKKIKVGDTIEYNTNNQEGQKKYEVILDKNKKKTLKEIKGGKKTRKRKNKKHHKSRKCYKSKKCYKSRKG